MKKLSKIDMYNLSCLKLAQMDVWSSQRCLESMKWGRKTRAWSQERYVKVMLEEMKKIDSEQPGLLEKIFLQEFNNLTEGDTNGTDTDTSTESIDN